MTEFSPGLAGVVAFETEIAEPDKEGGELRYRGVNIEELVGNVPFEQVWGLLVDESFEPGLPRAHEDLELRTGSYIGDLQTALASSRRHVEARPVHRHRRRRRRRRICAASRPQRSRSSRSRRAAPTCRPSPRRRFWQGKTAAERFLLAWRGEVNEKHARAIDTYWICTAEHGLNASTFTGRIVASTGADAAAALRRLSARSPARCTAARRRACCRCSTPSPRVATPRSGCTRRSPRGERIMGFGHRVYRAEDPRSRVLKRIAKELGSPRVAVAEELEQVAHEAIAKKSEGHSWTNVEYWSAVVLDVAEVPPPLAPAMFACSRTAGWSAHILEQKRLGVLIRPSAKYVGPGARSPAGSLISWRRS